MPSKPKIKVYCVLGQDPICDGEYQGDSWLIKIFYQKQKAQKFIDKNYDNTKINPITWHNTKCNLFIQEMIIQ